MTTGIPAFLIVRDRLTSLIELIGWLESAGFEEIWLVDNDSTCPPLLDYLASTTHAVVRTEKNLGHRSPWLSGVVQRHAHGLPFTLYRRSIDAMSMRLHSGPAPRTSPGTHLRTSIPGNSATKIAGIENMPTGRRQTGIAMNSCDGRSAGCRLNRRKMVRPIDRLTNEIAVRPSIVRHPGSEQQVSRSFDFRWVVRLAPSGLAARDETPADGPEPETIGVQPIESGATYHRTETTLSLDQLVAVACDEDQRAQRVEPCIPQPREKVADLRPNRRN